MRRPLPSSYPVESGEGSDGARISARRTEGFEGRPTAVASSLAMGGTLRHLRDLFHDGTAVGVGDGQLLARYAAARDEAAFAALVARHGPMVLSTCRAILRRDPDVEDAFQATFLVLARNARSV